MSAKSPFPGMDPYLEKYWGDVHTRLITYTSGHLQEQLPDDPRARAQERVLDNGNRPIYPDIYIAETAGLKSRHLSGRSSAAAVAEPFTVQLDFEPITQRYLEIVDKRDGKLVTVIENLSPANKTPGEGMNLYLQKQEECRRSGVNLVEIDLIRQGKRILLAGPERLLVKQRTLYQVCVWRSKEPLAAEVYAITLQQRLPAIKVPLRAVDVDVTLDLQAILEQCYRQGRYDDIDYSRAADPPLSDKDRRWLTKHVKGKKKSGR